MVFDNEFDDVLRNADLKYQRRKERYGDSWKQMSVKELYLRLSSEFIELKNAKSNEELNDELLDVINVALMMAQQLKGEY